MSIERVARAICEANIDLGRGNKPDAKAGFMDDDGCYHDLGKLAWETYIKDAHAALAALIQPISEAKKNGKWLLLLFPSGYMRLAQWTMRGWTSLEGPLAGEPDYFIDLSIFTEIMRKDDDTEPSDS